MSESEFEFDVVIVGGGPAGLSAARWCDELHLNAALIERSSEFGGQLLHIYNPITNYLGVTAANGRELCGHFLGSVEDCAFRRHLGANVTEIDVEAKRVTVESGETYRSAAIILAMGVSRRRLNVPGESEFEGRGILRSGAKERESVRGLNVAVIGGGDAAIENALILSDHAARVTVVHRRREFSARDEFVEKARARSNVEFLTSVAVKSISGDSRIMSVDLAEVETGREFTLPVDALLIRIGVEPNTKLVEGKLDLDRRGYILIDSACRTGVPGVYAIGDAACPVSPTVSTAAGMGATAAKAILALLYARK